jgi:hypothetical protein
VVYLVQNLAYAYKSQILKSRIRPSKGAEAIKRARVPFPCLFFVLGAMCYFCWRAECCCEEHGQVGGLYTPTKHTLLITAALCLCLHTSGRRFVWIQRLRPGSPGEYTKALCLDPAPTPEGALFGPSACAWAAQANRRRCFVWIWRLPVSQAR